MPDECESYLHGRCMIVNVSLTLLTIRMTANLLLGMASNQDCLQAPLRLR